MSSDVVALLAGAAIALAIATAYLWPHRVEIKQGWARLLGVEPSPRAERSTFGWASRGRFAATQVCFLIGIGIVILGLLSLVPWWLALVPLAAAIAISRWDIREKRRGQQS